MFYLFAFPFLICSVFTAETERLSRLELRLGYLENTLETLQNKVAAQQDEIVAQRISLVEKSREIAGLHQLLKQGDRGIKASVPAEKRRFLVDEDDLVFFARLDATELTGVAKNQTILFDNVLLNAGNAFDPKTSIFTAPHDGYYFFSVSVASDLGHNHQLQVALMKNGDMLARAHAHGDSGHLDQGSVTIVAPVAGGDKVSVKSTYDEVTDFYGGGLTTFTGYEVLFK